PPELTGIMQRLTWPVAVLETGLTRPEIMAGFLPCLCLAAVSLVWGVFLLVRHREVRKNAQQMLSGCAFLILGSTSHFLYYALVQRHMFFYWYWVPELVLLLTVPVALLSAILRLQPAWDRWLAAVCVVAVINLSFWGIRLQSQGGSGWESAARETGSWL